MARNEDEFYRLQENDRRPSQRSTVISRNGSEDFDELDERAVDLDTEEDSPFLRAERRIPVRRGPLPKRTATRLKYVVVALAVCAVLAAVMGWFYAYGTGSWRFRIDSSDNLEISGIQNVTRSQVLQVFGADIGRNIFFVPLDERRLQLQEIPWVQAATVMRLLPNRIRIQVQERTPVAFARIGSKVSLIDANGVVLEMPAKAARNYSFPVITGMQETEPLSTRSARMKIYSRLVGDLDSSGASYSQALSEVDLSDPEDVKVTVADANGAVLLHLGDDNFLDRYKIYLAHVEQWRQQFPRLDSVDLRYDRQVVVNPDSRAPQQPAIAAHTTSSKATPHKRQ